MTAERPEARPSPSWERVAGRCLDVTVATVVLLLLGPALPAITLWIRLDSPGPALFRQQRPGLGRRPFTGQKFRTMRSGADDSALRRLIEAEVRGEDTVRDGSTELAEDRGLLTDPSVPDPVTARAGAALYRYFCS